MPDEPIPDYPTLNPRYQGATPEDVARALLRRRPHQDLPPNDPIPLTGEDYVISGAASAGGQAVVGDEVTVEQPLPDQPGNDGSHLR